MKVRICIDGIVLDGLPWSSVERRVFERNLRAELHLAFAHQAPESASRLVGRRAGFESLWMPMLGVRDPRGVATALAPALARRTLLYTGGQSVTPKAETR